LLLRERALKASGLWLNGRELLRSGIRERPASIIQAIAYAIIQEVLLWNAGLHRILKATVLLQARVKLAEILRLLLLILEALWLLLLVLKSKLLGLRTIEASVLLL